MQSTAHPLLDVLTKVRTDRDRAQALAEKLAADVDEIVATLMQTDVPRSEIQAALGGVSRATLYDTLGRHARRAR